MAEDAPPQDAAPKKRSKLPLILGLGLALAGGGGGFFAAYSGLLPIGGSGSHAPMDGTGDMPDIAFVPIDPVVISLGPGGRNRHLRITAQVEVGRAYQSEVAILLPRILDVLNGYLRALDVAELEDQAALVRIRAHLLRRIQIVTGEGRVRNLLITEFVLN